VKILIIDDEKPLAEMVGAILHKNKIEFDIVFNGADAVEMIAVQNYDLIILDIMLPKLNGYEVIKKIRGKQIITPVLMLSAKSETEDKVDGLNLGADDYLTKPFAMEELLARINALTRRSGGYNNELQFGDCALDRNLYLLKCDKNAIRVGGKEYKIIEILLKNKKKITQKDTLTENVWDIENDSCYNNLEVYISFLRKKLSAIKSKVVINAVRGVGYKLEYAG
jgi:DNA-binding response OmpR family regulator